MTLQFNRNNNELSLLCLTTSRLMFIIVKREMLLNTERLISSSYAVAHSSFVTYIEFAMDS